MAFKIDYSPLNRVDRSQQVGAMTGLGGAIGDVVGEGLDTRRKKSLTSKATDASDPESQEQAQVELAARFPEFSKTIMDRIGADTEQKQKAVIYDLAEVSSLHQSGQPEAAIDYLDRRADAIDGRGGDSSHTRQIRDMYATDPEKGGQYIAMSLQSMINPEEFAKRLGGAGLGEEAKVGAQEILEDGTIIQSTPQGPVVFNPLGEKVTGQAAADAITIARAEKVSNLREAAGQKRAATLEEDLRLKAQIEAGIVSAKDAAQISTKAFERLENINTNIRNMDEGIQLLEDGAETGVVLKMLPSVRKNAIKLNNLQGRLGLDVLHSTTFGALSAAELKFALSTALPDKLGPEDLRDWMIERKNAQEKLSDYIEASAIFLGTPGNTVKDWMVLQREKRLERQETSGGGYTEGQTATGADGTKLVYTNGEWRPM